MDITRRKFFFFGLAAGVGLLLPDVKIELSKEELGQFAYFNPNGGDLGRLPISLYGIPYHQNDGICNNTFLGISREFYRT